MKLGQIKNDGVWEKKEPTDYVGINTDFGELVRVFRIIAENFNYKYNANFSEHILASFSGDIPQQIIPYLNEILTVNAKAELSEAELVVNEKRLFYKVLDIYDDFRKDNVEVVTESMMADKLAKALSSSMSEWLRLEGVSG